MSWNPSADERSLIDRASAGDEQALEELFRRHELVLTKRIQRLLPPYMRHRVAVSDVLQETRIVAFQKTGGFSWQGEGSFRGWLLAIADRKAQRAIQHHVAIEKRALGREVRPSRGSESRDARSDLPSPSQAAIGAELGQLARQALSELKPDYREVLRLCRDEGLTLREAAERMGRSREAVKKLYGRAVARFTITFNRLRDATHA